MSDVRLARCACGNSMVVRRTLETTRRYRAFCKRFTGPGQPLPDCRLGPVRSGAHAAALAWNRVMIAFWESRGCDPYTGKPAKSEARRGR